MGSLGGFAHEVFELGEHLDTSKNTVWATVTAAALAGLRV